MTAAKRLPGESVMAGGGYYSRHSKVQHVAAAPGFPFLERAAREVPILEGTPFVIGDFGCAGGRNELEPLRIAIGAVRERTARVPIVSSSAGRSGARSTGYLGLITACSVPARPLSTSR